MFSPLCRLAMHRPAVVPKDPVLTERLLCDELLRVLQTPKHTNNGDATLIESIKVRFARSELPALPTPSAMEAVKDVFIVPARGFAECYRGITLKIVYDGASHVALMIEDAAGYNLRFHHKKYNIMRASASASEDHGDYKIQAFFPIKPYFEYAADGVASCRIEYVDLKQIIDIMALIIVENIPVADEVESERVMRELGRADDV